MSDYEDDLIQFSPERDEEFEEFGEPSEQKVSVFSRVGPKIEEEKPSIKSRLTWERVVSLEGTEEKSSVKDRLTLPSNTEASTSSDRRIVFRRHQMTKAEKERRKVELAAERKQQTKEALERLGDRLKPHKRKWICTTSTAGRPPPSDDDFSDEDEDYSKKRWKMDKTKTCAQPDQEWAALQHGELVAREFSEWSCIRKTPVLMPKLTLAEARRRIKKGGSYHVGIKPEQKLRQFPSGTQISNNQVDIRRFISEARETVSCPTIPKETRN